MEHLMAPHPLLVLELPVMPLGMSWSELLQSLAAGFLGALVALWVVGRLRARLRRGGRGGVFRLGAGQSKFPAECEHVGCGLEEFSREMEERLDTKLDRLEELLKEADRVLYGEAGKTASERLRGAAGGASLEGDLGQITADERQQVLALAGGGKSPAAISEATGLPQGEVDLILRLYGRGSPARNETHVYVPHWSSRRSPERV